MKRRERRQDFPHSRIPPSYYRYRGCYVVFFFSRYVGAIGRRRVECFGSAITGIIKFNLLLVFFFFSHSMFAHREKVVSRRKRHEKEKGEWKEEARKQA